MAFMPQGDDMMKRIFLAITMICMLCFGSTAFAASNGQILMKEEAVASQVMTALTGIMSYDRISPSFTPELQQTFGKEQLTAMKKEVKTRFGKLQDMKLVSLQKFDQGDRVIYLANFAKQNLVRVEFLFNVTTPEPQVMSFALAPIEAQQKQAQQ